MSLLAWPLYLAHALFTPLLLIGLLRKGKAQRQGRVGPSIWQPYWDLLKLARKGETVSETNTWVFRAAPLVFLASTLAIALSVPWLGSRAPVPGDLFLMVYLLALGKFATSLAALDPGTTFGALGASREATVSLQAEPALVLALGALAVHAHSSDLAVLLAPGQCQPEMYALVLLVLVTLWLTGTAELARMPFDDPTTHLELTMIHEALLLENSGRNLALIELGVALKTSVILGLMAQVALLACPALGPLAAWAATAGLMLGAVGLLVLIETVGVRLRWLRLPNLLAFALATSVLACLVVALKG